ncbi:hypothetical protein CTAYLR_001842 [Chrysophaeum taylorii]|uniref:Fe2OG dioxygenase domain-containing protein n=1 Tax=Chrysophaeum taylorii TaxID=2483200 RepID=A0AAD7UA84_9STRA|nr:hypothetical protein CTAYLR_001842 [Chrysophaeum taylorii]
MKLLPVVDFGSRSSTTIAELDAACRAHGFVLAVNSGISKALSEEAFAAAKELFAMPESAKLGLTRISAATNRGYAPLKLESLNHARGADQKESFNVRFSNNDLDGCPESFVAVVPKLLEAAREACRRYTVASALALGLDPRYFSRHFETMEQCTIRFLHYPPPRGESLVRLGEHTDFGLFTLVFVDQSAAASGLQLKPEGAKEWTNVDGSEADCVVNTGALAARWTNDCWCATEHRVVVPDSTAARGHRYSIAFFFDPDPDALVAVDPKFCASEPPRYSPITAGDYLSAKLRAMAPTNA